MFRAIKIVLVAMTFSGLGMATTASAAPVANLLLHSPLDVGTFSGVTPGSTVNDIVAPAQNGTVVGANLASVTGLMGEAFNFPAAGTTYANYGNVHNPGTGDFTASVWFNPDLLPSGFGFIVGKGTQATTSNGWSISVQNDTAVFRAKTNTSSLFTIVSDAASIAAGNWYHAAVVFDRTADTATAYLNGSDTAAFTTNGINIGTDSLSNTAAALVLGVRSTNFNLGLDGTLDDFALWDRALSSEEISQIYTSGLLGFNVQQDAPLPVPEPSSFVILSLFGLVCVRRFRRANQS